MTPKPPIHPSQYGRPAALARPVARPEPPAPLPTPPDCRRAAWSLANAAAALAAMARGEVPAEEAIARRGDCATCDMRCTDEAGDFCGVCGCAVGAAGAPLRIFDLTRYKEDPADPLCKHSQRPAGKGWKKRA